MTTPKQANLSVPGHEFFQPPAVRVLTTTSPAAPEFPTAKKFKFIDRFENICPIPGCSPAGNSRGDGDAASSREGLIDAHCAGCTVDGSDSAQALWRHRTCRVVAHGGADRSRP